jgi:signal transduction histidine kinase/CheY-like chemotaxis protein
VTTANESSRSPSTAKRSALLGSFVGVRGRLLALVVLALLPALGLTVYRAVEDRRDATTQAQTDALAVAEGASRTQAQLIDEAHQLLFGLAQLSAVREADAESCSTLLAGIVRTFDAYANLGVIDRNGDLACSGVPFTGRVNYSDRTYFQRALASGEFAVGEYQIGRVTARRTLNVAYPILERGRARGVVYAALDLAWVGQLVFQANLPPRSVITVLDDGGTILARQPESERWVGRTLPEAELAEAVRTSRKGVVTVRGLDGVSRFYGIVPLLGEDRSVDVFVTVGIPTEAALAGAGRKLTRDLMVLGVVGLIALAAALAGGYIFLVRPIDALGVAASSLRTGRFGVRTEIDHAPRELRELGRTFDDMADSLENREEELRRLNADLERRIAERTAELEDANDELARQVRINQTVLDATTDAIALTDLEGNLLVANAATRSAMELLGVQPGASRTEIVEQASTGTTDPQGFVAELAANVADPEREAVYEYELAGGGRWFRRYTGPVRDESGAVIARIFTTREVTAEREAEALKSELVATVSHELRTPLASILGFTELLIEREVDEETRARYLGTVRAEAGRLTDLINDFLDLQRIEEGSFTPSMELLRLEDVLREQVEIFSAQSKTHELELTLPPVPLSVVAERGRVGQVVANLLSNAIKYSPAGGRVEVSGEVRDDAVRVTVSDQGLGIPTEQQKKLFTKFFRVDSSDTRAIGGTGLGLALARELVHAHHGRIGFESVEGSGSTFWFELPAARRGATGSGRVLVVEDDPAAASLMAEYLTADGYEVEIVASGEDAVERVLHDPPVLVSLDIELAGSLDGWQVLTALKANPETADIPVFVCTAGNGRPHAASLGAADFLVKPFSAKRVRDVVARLLPTGGSVLVVDDEASVRELVCGALSAGRYELTEAADGEEAVALIRAKTPDAVVLDLVMPKLDGFGVLEQMLDDPSTRDVPVVVLTGKELSDDERRVLRSRAFSVLEKSASSAAELRRLVGEAVARTSGEQPLDST